MTIESVFVRAGVGRIDIAVPASSTLCLLPGYVGGLIHMAIMRLIDGLMAFPSISLVILDPRLRGSIGVGQR